MRQAFILGAGLGTRLKPLTDFLPKPLVPLYHRPLAAWTVDSLARAGIHRFAINTHHLPEAWESFDPGAGNEISFFHEPVLLETGGGLKNLGSWMGGDPVLVHNGDIFTTLPLDELIAAHEASGLPVTLALRTDGDAKHIAIDSTGTRVTDIRGRLGIAEGTHHFSGVYCVNPEFLDLIPADTKISVIPAFLELAAEGQLGAVVLDSGVWLELGTPGTYLEAHRQLELATAIHPDAIIEPGAVVIRSVVGPGAVIESGARVIDSVVWPDCRVSSGSVIEEETVFSSSSPAATPA